MVRQPDDRVVDEGGDAAVGANRHHFVLAGDDEVHASVAVHDQAGAGMGEQGLGEISTVSTVP